VTITLADKKLVVIIGEASITINGQKQELSEKVVIENGRAMFPADVLEQLLGK
jgi:hypothetical protein